MALSPEQKTAEEQKPSESRPVAENQQSAETPSAPQTHIIGPGEIVMSGKSGLAVGTDRIVPTKNNSDIGKAAAVRNLVCGKAREELKAGWRKRGKTKTELELHLSNWLKSHHHQLPGDPLLADDLHLDPHQVGRIITPVWREFPPDDA
jgi:hypothetical protein